MKKLLKNYIYNFISQILTLIVPLLTTPYVSRILHEEGIGKYSYSFSIITYFILFANLGFTIYGQREIAKNRDEQEKLSRTFFEILILKTISTLISTIVLISLIFTIGFGEKYNTLILILGIQLISCAFDIQFLFQGIEDFKSIAIRSILAKIIGLVGIFAFVKKENDLWIYVLCLSISVIVSTVLMWPRAIKMVRKVSLKSLNLKQHIIPSLLIFLPTLAITIYSVLDRTMIGLLASNPDYENGCYEQAYKMNSIILILVTIISPIMLPRNVYEYSKNNIEALKNNIYYASNYVWMIGLPLIAGVCVLGANLSSWFFGDGYLEVPLLLMIMSIRFVSSGFSEIFGTQLFIPIGKEKYLTFSVAVAALVNFGLNFIFIPWLGATGAAITTAIAEVIVAFMEAIFVYRMKIVSLRKILLSSWQYILGTILMFTAIFFLNKYLSYSILSFIIITIIGGIIYFAFLLIIKNNFLLLLINKVLKKNINTNLNNQKEDKAVAILIELSEHEKENKCKK